MSVQAYWTDVVMIYSCHFTTQHYIVHDMCIQVGVPPLGKLCTIYTGLYKPECRRVLDVVRFVVHTVALVHGNT